MDDARAQSLALFREHKVAEQRHDLELVEQYVERKHKEQIASRAAAAKGEDGSSGEDSTLSFFHRVLSFAQEDGGGATATASGSLAEAALRRFGLDAYIAKCCQGGAAPPAQSPSKANVLPSSDKGDKGDKGGKKGFKKKKKEEKVAESSSVLRLVRDEGKVHYARCLDTDGNIDFDYVFGEGSAGAPLKLEVGSGQGVAVAQAAYDTLLAMPHWNCATTESTAPSTDWAQKLAICV